MTMDTTTIAGTDPNSVVLDRARYMMGLAVMETFVSYMREAAGERATTLLDYCPPPGEQEALAEVATAPAPTALDDDLVIPGQDDAELTRLQHDVHWALQEYWAYYTLEEALTLARTLHAKTQRLIDKLERETAA